MQSPQSHLANEARLVSALLPEEREQLAALLRTLLIEFGNPTQHRPDERLGLRVSATHVVHQRRAAVGSLPQLGSSSSGFAPMAGQKELASPSVTCSCRPEINLSTRCRASPAPLREISGPSSSPSDGAAAR